MLAWPAMRTVIDNGAAYPAPPRGQRTVRSASLGITLRGISR
jgi:hypothetical protein